MKISKRIISFVLCFVMLTACLYTGTNAFAESPTHTGTVTNVNSSLNVRSGPGTSYDKIGSLSNNSTVEIYGGTAQNGWYKIKYGTGVGYVSADYITNVKLIPVYEPEADFEKNLETQGFPESYKVLLRSLHASHPEWIFLADHLAMTFDEALTALSRPGASLLQLTSSSTKLSWLSMEYGCYNWSSGEYEVFDSGNWVTAHRDVVAYYLEPRNFINESDIYLFLDQAYNENVQNKEGLQKILNGTFMEGAFPEDTYATYADILMYAGKNSGVSPYMLASMIIQEQGSKGTGSLISGTVSGYTGLYNHFSIGAYKDGNMTAVQRGLWYAKGGNSGNTSYSRPWNTRAKSIIGGSVYFGESYILRGQSTPYYKKFNVIKAPYYSHQYMTNVAGGRSEGRNLNSAYSEIGGGDMPLTFSIPVYKNMPATNTTSLSTSNGANNYFLQSLSVDGQSLTPSFNMYTNSYEMIVDNSVSSVNVSATPVSGAKVSGTGKHDLKVGSNTVKVTVTAESGKTADYIITVTRKEGNGSTSVPAPDITTSYTVGEYFTGVEPQTSVSTFKGKITVKNGTLKVVDSSGKEKTSGNIATGDKVTVYKNDGTAHISKTVIIYGDTNGDGKISISDLGNVKKHLLEVSTLSGNKLTAADTNKDGRISIVDMANVKKHLLAVKDITQ